jgi:prefoldin subunit 5
MPTLNFKLSDGQKHEKLFYALNPNFTEEGNWTIECSICEIYDEYALVWNYETNKYARAYYTKNDDDTITLGDVVDAFIVDVTETEYNTLMAVQALNNGTYENMQEVVEKGLKADEQISEFEQKLAENEETISTLTTERDTFSTQAEEAQTQIEELNGTVEELNGTIEGLNETVEGLNATVEELNTFKSGVETEKKTAIVDKYALRLDEEKIEAYRARLGEFTISDLEKELALELVAHDPSIFSAQGAQNGFIPKSDEYEEGSLEALLSKYKKN